MRLRTNITLLLAILVACLAIFEFANPSRQSRLGPAPLLLIAVLLGVRYGVARQAQKRTQMAKHVSPRPLGLTDESSDHS